MAVGENVIASAHSLSIGGGANSHCTSADGQSIAVGNGVSARNRSIAVGSHSTVADTNALSIGGYCVASGTGSVAIGFRNSAYGVMYTGGGQAGGQAFGRSLEISGGLAIGYYNATKDAAFVIGDGTGNDDDTVVNRSDSFVIYRDGSVSAKGDISANGVKLGPGGGGSFTGVVTGTGLSGNGLSNSPLGIDTAAAINFTNLTSNKVFVSGTNFDTLGQSRIDGNDNCYGTNWMGVSQSHAGFLKYIDGQSVGDTEISNAGSGIQIEFKPNSTQGDLNIINTYTGTQTTTKVINVPTASYTNMSTFDSENGPNYMLRKTANGFDIGAAVINTTELPANVQANAYYFIYEM